MSTKEDKTEEEISAEKLFGMINPLKKDLGEVPTAEDLIKLNEPINPEDGIINVLCLKHHDVFPITEEGRDDLLGRTTDEEPSVWTGKYFQVTGCIFCTPNCVFENPMIRDFRSN